MARGAVLPAVSPGPRPRALARKAEQTPHDCPGDLEAERERAEAAAWAGSEPTALGSGLAEPRFGTSSVGGALMPSTVPPRWGAFKRARLVLRGWWAALARPRLEGLRVPSFWIRCKVLGMHVISPTRHG